MQDIEAVDPEYYKNLKWMLENDITDVLDLTFTAESDFFGKTEVGAVHPMWATGIARVSPAMLPSGGVLV